MITHLLYLSSYQPLLPEWEQMVTQKLGYRLEGASYRLGATRSHKDRIRYAFASGNSSAPNLTISGLIRAKQTISPSEKIPTQAGYKRFRFDIQGCSESEVTYGPRLGSATLRLHLPYSEVFLHVEPETRWTEKGLTPVAGSGLDKIEERLRDIATPLVKGITPHLIRKGVSIGSDFSRKRTR